MLKTARFLISAAFLLAPLVASAIPLQASGPASKSAVIIDFRNHRTQVIDALEKKGYAKFGSLDLQSVRDFMNGMHVSLSDSVDPGFARHEKSRSGIESRDTAEWFSDQAGNIIILSRGDWPRASENAKQILPIHEYLGPMKFNDHDCGISCGMWLLAQNDVMASLTADEKEKIETHIGDLAMNGGVTGVGGGGDYRPVDDKTTRLKSEAQQLAQLPPGAERDRAMKDLLDVLDSPFKVFPTTTSGQFIPVTQPIALRNWKMCKILPTLSPALQEHSHAVLIANGDAAARKAFPTTQSMLAFCKMMIKQGPKAFGVKE